MESQFKYHFRRLFDASSANFTIFPRLLRPNKFICISRSHVSNANAEPIGARANSECDEFMSPNSPKSGKASTSRNCNLKEIIARPQNVHMYKYAVHKTLLFTKRMNGFEWLWRELKTHTNTNTARIQINLFSINFLCFIRYIYESCVASVYHGEITCN